MGSDQAIAYSHDDIDQSSIQVPSSYSHDDIDHTTVVDPAETKTPIQKMNESGDAANNALLDTVLAGHLPQVKAKVKQILSGEGFSNDENYVKRRDLELADMKSKAEKYPAANLEGKIVGLVAPLLLTGGSSIAEEGPAAAAELTKQGALKAATKGAVVGAAMGGLQNPGDTEGKVDPFQLSERSKNAKVGAGAGALLGAAANKLPDVADAIGQYAPKQALKAAGAMLKDFRKEYANETVADTGKFILENGLVKAGDTVDSIAEKASALKERVGNDLGAGYDAAVKILPKLGKESAEKVASAGFNPVRDKAAILASVKKDLGYAYKGRAALKGVEEYLDQLIEEHGDQVLNPKVTNKIKSSLDKTAIDWERNPLAREPDSEAALKSLRSALSDKVSGQIEAIGKAVGDPDAAGTLAKLNRDYGMASKVERIAADRSNRDAANKAFGLTDTIWGAAGASAGAAIGGPIGAAIGAPLAAGAGKVARTYGPSIVADTTNVIGKNLSKLPIASAAQQANPGVYRALTDEIENKAPAVIQMTEKPTPKGQDKWANDGFKNLVEHAKDSPDADAVSAAKEKLMSTPSGRSILIQASDLKPNSKAMKKVMEKIKTSFLKKDDE